MFCKTYGESLQKQAVNMDLQCILYIADSSYYAIKTPKDEVTCNGTYILDIGVSCSKRESWNVCMAKNSVLSLLVLEMMVRRDCRQMPS